MTVTPEELSELERLCVRSASSALHVVAAEMRRAGGGARGQTTSCDGSSARQMASDLERTATLALDIIAAYREAVAEVERLRGEVEEYRAAERFEQERNP